MRVDVGTAVTVSAVLALHAAIPESAIFVFAIRPKLLLLLTTTNAFLVSTTADSNLRPEN